MSRLLSIPVGADDTASNLFSSSPHKRPNHVLINEYPPGVGIMPHKVGLLMNIDCVWERGRRKTHLRSRTEPPTIRLSAQLASVLVSV